MEHKKAGPMRCLIPPMCRLGHLPRSHKTYNISCPESWHLSFWPACYWYVQTLQWRWVSCRYFSCSGTSEATNMFPEKQLLRYPFFPRIIPWILMLPSPIAVTPTTKLKMLLNPCCIYLQMSQQSVVHKQKLRHVTNEHVLLLSLEKERKP